MQLTINVKDSVVDKVLYLLENLKSDVQIVSKTQSSFDELSEEELKTLNKMSDEYKSGKRDEFEEYAL
jgi:methyl coenzyme M reductase subunit C